MKEDFEMAFEAEFGKKPEIVCHNIDEIWEGSKSGAFWAAKWMAERCAEKSIPIKARQFRQMAKELS